MALKPANATLKGQELSALITELRGLGLTGTALASIIVSNMSRGEAAERLAEHCRTFEKGS